ncbi:hypothetical protein CesoFtcFv8_004608 [Champsocephalus esox]|uniref:Uncharacterized protein n=1 Tax=Champsocephalus esox TaxID=159716 RepID=A0AAN8HBM6_9TELE|nr:hypothetical protein CesoFtcFv8_004608 [Champsocephalus esox]
MAVALDAVWLRVKNVCKQNGLLIMSVLAVIIGCLLGFFLRTKRLTEQVSVSPPLTRCDVMRAEDDQGSSPVSHTSVEHYAPHVIYCIIMLNFTLMLGRKSVLTSVLQVIICMG